MKVAVYHPNFKPTTIAQVVAAGFQAHGHETKCRSLERTVSGAFGIFAAGDEDLAVIVDRKDAYAFSFFKTIRKPFIYIGQAYCRDGNWRRVVFNDVHPTEYVGKLNCPSDRFEQSGWEVHPWRVRTDDFGGAEGDRYGHIVYAADDPNNARWQQSPTWRLFTEHLIKDIRAYSKRSVVFRPNPKHLHAPDKMPGYIMESVGQYPLKKSIKDAHCLIVVDSSACVTALLMGIPTIVLGNAVTRNICSTTLTHLEYPYKAYPEQRMSLLSDLAYCQWHLEEISSGYMWNTYERFLLGRIHDVTARHS